MLNSLTRRFAALILALAVVGLTGCDSSTGVDGSGDVTLQGRVTDDAGFGKAGTAQGNVDGAVVTAANVSANGSLNQLQGEATTNAEGRFDLAVDGAAEELVIVAQKAGFESRAMVYTQNRGDVTTMPLTSESRVEADVFVEARRQDDTDEVTMADVAAYVTSQAAAEVHAGHRDASELAAAIVTASQTRMNYVRDEAGDEEAEEARENQNGAFFELQVELAASADADAETDAMERFEEALIEAYTRAGVALSTQARARESARAALVRAGSATFDAEKKATVLASMASALAIEADFESAGASSARLNALAQARENLISKLRSSSSSSAIADARAEYEVAVESELAAEADVEQAVLASATSAIATAKTALNVALTAAGSAAAVANAFAEFYASAETSALSALEGATNNAELAARVLTILNAS